jgi:Domain of unknown function (DUF4352)
MYHKKSMKIGLTFIVLCLIGLSMLPFVAAADIGTIKYDWKGYMTDKIDNYKAPTGQNYVVVTIYIKNDGTKPISTGGGYWKLVADGIEYNYDAASYKPSISHIDTDVLPGSETETTLAFFVKGKPNITSLKYTGFGQVLTHISHYDHSY